MCRAFAAASQLSYRSAPEIKLEARKIFAFREVFVLDDRETGARCFIGVALTEILVCFTGSQNLKDWLADVDAHMIDLPRIGRCHEGIHRQLSALWLRIMVVVQRSDIALLPIYVAGHSLGGALAMLFSVLLDHETDRRRVAGGYTFGAPRFGDRRLARLIPKTVWRIINGADIVPRLPLWSLGWPKHVFCHGGSEGFIDALGLLRVKWQAWRRLPTDLLLLVQDLAGHRLSFIVNHYAAAYVERVSNL